MQWWCALIRYRRLKGEGSGMTTPLPVRWSHKQSGPNRTRSTCALVYSSSLQQSRASCEWIHTHKCVQVCTIQLSSELWSTNVSLQFVLCYVIAQQCARSVQHRSMSLYHITLCPPYCAALSPLPLVAAGAPWHWCMHAYPACSMESLTLRAVAWAASTPSTANRNSTTILTCTVMCSTAHVQH